MAKTFKVGDKVRILDKDAIELSYELTNGGIYEVKWLDSLGDIYIEDTVNSTLQISTTEFHAIELVEATPTKKQRIEALENEVEALKARIEALEKSKSYVMGVDIEKEFTPKTPNQRRKAVIERAKSFVADVEDMAKSYRDGKVTDLKHTLFKKCTNLVTKPEYHVNKEKRVVTVLVKGANNPVLYEKAIAKCAPDDVFNEHIGKAIALSKAYGLECPKEFMDAPQPEPAVGQHIEVVYAGGRSMGVDVPDKVEKVHGKFRLSRKGEGLTGGGSYTQYRPEDGAQILDDTEAQYV